MRRWLSLAILLSLALACGPKLTWAIYTTDDGLAGNEVRDLFVDAQGRIWAGTWGGPEGGASVFAGENWTPFTVDEGLAHKNVNAVFVDREDNAWFATERGLSLFDGSEWTTYTEEDGLADDIVLSVTVAPNGDVWAGTTEGLSFFDGSAWTTYTEEAGLAGGYGPCHCLRLQGQPLGGLGKRRRRPERLRRERLEGLQDR